MHAEGQARTRPPATAARDHCRQLALVTSLLYLCVFLAGTFMPGARMWLQYRIAGVDSASACQFALMGLGSPAADESWGGGEVDVVDV